MDAPTVVGLFAGVGGFEEGLSRAGFETRWMCEWWDPAQRVLADRFPGATVSGDIREVDRLPRADVVTAGFPCTDLSQAGRMVGIEGSQSGLVMKALSLVEKHGATWIVLENVRNMLHLHSGRAMAAITTELDRMGFAWAYRLVDSRFSGVPQRRHRVVLVASRLGDPREVLLSEDEGMSMDVPSDRPTTFGFYWTEGLRGVGWVEDGVPPLKGGSTVGIPSAPAVWRPDAPLEERFVVPGIETGERLQGFVAGHTAAVTGARSEGVRWKLVGNAVTVSVATWLGDRLRSPLAWDPSEEPVLLEPGSRWPAAAYGMNGRVWQVAASAFPRRLPVAPLHAVMGRDHKPLSQKAASGFLGRLERSTLRVPEAFRLDLKEYVERTRPATTRLWS